MRNNHGVFANFCSVDVCPERAYNPRYAGTQLIVGSQVPQLDTFIHERLADQGSMMIYRSL